jgi:hypothetical protein
MRSGALRAHDSLVAKSKSGERNPKKGHFSLLSGEEQPAFVLEKTRASLPKSTSPPVSSKKTVKTVKKDSLKPPSGCGFHLHMF